MLRLSARLPLPWTLVLAISVPGLPAQVPPKVAAHALAFAKKSTKEQEAALDHVEQQLVASESPWLRALRSCSEDAGVASKPRTHAFPKHDAGKKAPKADAKTDDGLPNDTNYVFGLGVIETGEAGGTRTQAAGVRKARFTAALLGAIPQVDRALASLLRRLDADPSADRFAAFLESWHNGEESFYEALDRTAGTKDSVFFYDVMLGDFTTQFAKGGGLTNVADPKKGLQVAHDALHDGFLAYRQYRAFREAVAWSMVLPPDRPLPGRLARYEQKVAGAYSLREQVVMVLANEGYDPRKVADIIGKAAAKLPDPLWSKTYDPYPSWNDAFQGSQARMIEAAGSTDEFLAKAQAALQAAATSIQAAAVGEVPGKP